MKSHMTFFALFISIFFVVGFALLGYGIHSYHKGRVSRSWPQTVATINRCEIKEDSDSDGTTWKVEVGYSYSVAGSDYSGDRVAFGYSGSSTRAEHRAIYDKIHRAKSVYVRYDPENPASSVIAPGFNRSTFLALAFAITWLLFTTGFTVLWTSASGKDARILEQIHVVE